MDALAQWGLWGLGLSSFLAATILPLSSELVLSALLLAGYPTNQLLWVATAGNVAGAIVNYALGRWCGDWLLQRGLHMRHEQIQRADNTFQRYGQWSLLFSWLPVIGDPLTFVAGIFKLNMLIFVLLVTIGKATRYWLLADTLLKLHQH